MSTPPDTSLFVDVADAIGLGNPAIVEKDYYVVQLLHDLRGEAVKLSKSKSDN